MLQGILNPTKKVTNNANGCIKSSSLAYIKYQLLAMGGFAVVFNGWVIISYHKRS
jgi:hypothetical protein